MENIDRWLKSLRLHKYTHLFRSLTYEEMLNINEKFLIDLDITKGARNKILVSIKKLNLRHDRLVNMEDDINQDNISMKEALTVMREMLITPIPSPINESSPSPTISLAESTNSSTSPSSTTGGGTMSDGISSGRSSTTNGSYATDVYSTSSTNSTPSISVKSTTGFGSLSTILSKTSCFYTDPYELTYLFVETFEKLAQRLIDSGGFEDNACHGIMAAIVDECLKHNSFTKEQKARVARFRQPIMRDQKVRGQYPFRRQLRTQHLQPRLAPYREYSLFGPYFELPCLKAKAEAEKRSQFTRFDQDLALNYGYEAPLQTQEKHRQQQQQQQHRQRQQHQGQLSNSHLILKQQAILSRLHQNVNYRTANQKHLHSLPKLYQTTVGRERRQSQSQDQNKPLDLKHNGVGESSTTSSFSPPSTAPSPPPPLPSKSSLDILIRASPQLIFSSSEKLNNPTSQNDGSGDGGGDGDGGGGGRGGGFTMPPKTTTSSQATSSTDAAQATTTSAAISDNTGLSMASSISHGIATPPLGYENPAAMSAAAMLSSNLIDSIDVDGLTAGGLGLGGLGGASGAANYDYTYQALPSRESQFTISSGISPSLQLHTPRVYGPSSSSSSSNNNSTVALYRLLNLIDQSGASPMAANSPLVSLPSYHHQNSKLTAYSTPSSPIPITSLVGGARLLPSSLMHANSFDDYNSYNHQTIAPMDGGGGLVGNFSRYATATNLNHAQFNGTSTRSHLPLASHHHQPHHNYHRHPPHNNNNNINNHQQTSSSSMPNHWSRKRPPASLSQAYWQRQLGLGGIEAADLNLQTNGLGAGGGGGAATSTAKQQLNHNSNNLFADNMIEVQPAAMKLIKSSSSSYLNTQPRRNNSHQHQQYYYQQQHHHDRDSMGGGGGANLGGQVSGHGVGGGGSHHNLNNGSTSNYLNNNNNNDNFNSILNGAGMSNNEQDVGFGSKQASPQQQPTLTPAASPPSTTTASNSFSEKLNGALTSSSSTNSKMPHDADSEMIAANNAPRCDKFTPDICVDDFEYPEQAIIDEIQKKRDVFELMYSEVKDNEPLVDGIPRDVEESYNYDYYYYGKTNMSQAASQPGALTSSVPSGSSGGGGHSIGAGLRLSHGPRSGSASSHKVAPDLDGPLVAAAATAGSPSISSNIDGMDALIGATPQATNAAATTAQQSPPSTGYICPSEVMYGKPKLAKNKKGLWKVIVNAGEFTQTVRLEKCLFPNKRCNYVSAQSYESRCAQVHSYHRLLVFEKGRGFYIDTFRLPTGCNCHVSKKPYAAGSSLSSSSMSSITSGANGGGGNRREISNQHESGNDQYPNSGGRPAGSRLPALMGDSSPHSHRSQGSSEASYSPVPPRGPSSESMLSQTLWSILSGGGTGGNGGGHNYNNNQLAASWNQNYGSGGGAMTNLPPQNYQTSGSYEPAATSGDQSNHFNDQHHLLGSLPPEAAMMPPAPQPPSSSLFDYQRSDHGGGGGGNSQREAHQSQSLILEHLSRNPSLAANISDSVLRQLIDVGQIGAGSTNTGSIVSGASDGGHSEGGGSGAGGGGDALPATSGRRYQNQNRMLAGH